MDIVYSLGIDVGSTTIKLVVIDENENLIYHRYERHYSLVKEKLIEELKFIENKYPNQKFKVCLTGSAALGLSQKTSLPFVQEVFSSFIGVKKYDKDVDVVIELGGEDAKIIFLSNGVEQRMNGSCAGGTGAFIDQMATLLALTPLELNKLSLKAEKIYPIASRCGVFAKSDIQPLINQGAKKEDIAASIFKAVVNQTIQGLAQGREIKGKVMFLGGPLTYLSGLRNSFIETLKLEEGNYVLPDISSVFMAYGASLYATKLNEVYLANELISKISAISFNNFSSSLAPLFNNKEEYEEFKLRHLKADVKYAKLEDHEGECYLGIDAGSTTIKLVLINKEKEILYSYYDNSKGKPLERIVEQLKIIYSLNPKLEIKGSTVTGYGEELLKQGLGIDYGIVETLAHYKAASHFNENVDFIIDIGGQDIKCFKIKNKAIDSIVLNEACSSGCGSFIQTFAEALGYGIDEFSKIGLFSKSPVDLGSRCTVFMNSSVKQAQKDGASVSDISAGLSISIIKNAIYKVIRARFIKELGENILVQGGTFLNDAVLRAFEIETGKNVIRPTISGLMGAFGAALYSLENKCESTIIKNEDLDDFKYKSIESICRACNAHCHLNIITFPNGKRFISNNRCNKVDTTKKDLYEPSIYDYKYELLNSYRQSAKNKKYKVGLPMALNFYDQLPFFKTLFEKLDFEVVISNESSKQIFNKGSLTIASDTVCYPAKLANGHVIDLLDQNVDFIFYPCQTYNRDEKASDNHFNCPVVAYYPETLIANNKRLNPNNFKYPYIDTNNPKQVLEELHKVLKDYKVTKKMLKEALDAAYKEQEAFISKLKNEGIRLLNYAKENHKQVIVLAGRPYHLDSEINHGICKYISSLGIVVLNEEVISMLAENVQTKILNQWTYHARLFKCANFVSRYDFMELVQLVSFGCGMDAITSDEVRRILEENGKLYTQVKIDEITNLGAFKIRLRSLLAAVEERKRRGN